jgi:superfamily II DNA or RNA helicase
MMFDHLRYYQNEARIAIRNEWDRVVSTACIMPTATGKTEVYLSLAVEEVGRVLVLVHRDYLISSPVERLARIGFTDVGVEKAKLRSEDGLYRGKIVFASVQSIGPEKQLPRLLSFDPKKFSLLIVDEGHRAVSDSYRRVLAYFRDGNPKLKVLILTATPKRKDGLALGNICESVAYEMTPGAAAEEGWIVPPRFFRRDVPNLDFSRVLMKGSDMDPDAMAEALLEEGPLHEVCASLADDQGPTIVFGPKVLVVQTYAAAMSMRYRPDRAMAVHEGSTDEEMERATKGLADGTIDYVFNVDKITEGYDVPACLRVAWVAPTASLVRWTQGCGRGFRPHHSIARHLTGGRDQAGQRRLLIAQSPKPECEIVTYYPSNCRHQICSAVDLLGGRDLAPDVYDFSLQVQEETSKQPGGSSTGEDVETARVFCDLRAALEEKRKDLKAQATVVDTEYDGMGGKAERLSDSACLRSDEMAVAASWGAGNPASEKQVKWLRWKGLTEDQAALFTKWRACVVRDLYEMGMPLEKASAMRKRQALKVRDEMKAK